MNSKSVLSNFFWRLAERSAAQIVSLIVSIILARILDPENYGIIALVTVFTNILYVFVNSGMATALIQKKDVDDLDYSTVFFFNLSMCIFLYIIMVIVAPFIAKFYDNKSLTPVIRVLSLTLVISGVKNVQQAYVSRNMMFKRFFFSTIVGTVFAAVVGIVMAYSGLGVWALVAEMLVNNAIDTIILWITVKWRPKKCFSFRRLKQLFSFGWKLLISSLLDTIYNELRQLIIGKVYTENDLAFYNQGDKFPKVIVTNINTSIDSVLLPTMSKEQDNPDVVRNMTRRAIKTSTYIMMPLMVGLAVCAEPIISLIFTDKWLPCVPFLRIFCFCYAFYPVHTANLNAIKAMGRSDLFLKLEVIKKIIGILAIIITIKLGVFAIACSLLVTTVLGQIINSWPNKKILNYSYLNQVKDMLPQILLSIFMGMIVYSVTLLKAGNIATLLIQILVGVFIYITGSKLFHIESFEYLLNTGKDILKRK